MVSIVDEAILSKLLNVVEEGGSVTKLSYLLQKYLIPVSAKIVSVPSHALHYTSLHFITLHLCLEVD